MKTFLQILILICDAFQINKQVKIKINPKLYAKDLGFVNEAFDTEYYLNAIRLYKKVISIKPNHTVSNLNSKINRIRLNQPIDSCVTQMVKLKNIATPEVQFYFNKIYRLTSNFEEAIKCFTKYKSINAKKRKITNIEMDYNIDCSKSAMAKKLIEKKLILSLIQKV